MLHQTIKEGVKEAMRAKNTLRLEVLRGLNALIMNEMIASKVNSESLPDDKVLALIKRSAKQRKDSIEQFEKGGRMDLVEKEKAELEILNSFLPQMMSRDEIREFAFKKVTEMKAAGAIDAKAGGKVVGMIMKDLAGRADGADVKAVVEEILMA